LANIAAAVVALMYAGGQYLEAFAEKRARREMTALLARAPRSAMRYQDGELAEAPLDAILPGDRLLIRRGDVVPADGVVDRGVALLDQSALTGERFGTLPEGGAAMSARPASATPSTRRHPPRRG
jgi:P-type E1-E2 ATPase